MRCRLFGLVCLLLFWTAGIIAMSLAIVPWVLREFAKAGTYFDARKPVVALITGGPFRFSRNPSYVAMTLLCVGVAVVTDTLWILFLAGASGADT